MENKSAVEQKTVTVPAKTNHGGYATVSVTLDWVCPICGKPRGEIYNTFSYDGSRRLSCDGWKNPCGHVDKYSDVRQEAAARQKKLDADTREKLLNKLKELEIADGCIDDSPVTKKGIVAVRLHNNDGGTFLFTENDAVFDTSINPWNEYHSTWLWDNFGG